ncbi:MAG: hypothetical protein D6B26_04795, partial [Spirochaetaceae bacterium]
MDISANLTGINLSTDSLNSGFTAGIYSYTVSVPNATSEITVTGVPQSAEATVDYSRGSAMGISRVFCGGSWDHLAVYAMVADRRASSVYGQGSYYGFRVAVSASVILRAATAQDPCDPRYDLLQGLDRLLIK